MRNRPDPAELARYVRQRMELGAGEWVLDGLTTSQALKLAREAGARPGDIARPTRGPNPAGPVAPTRGRTSKPGPETGAEPPPPPIRLPTVHAELEEVAQSCTRCRLAGTRTRVVFADGSPKARLMIVGEAPRRRRGPDGPPLRRTRRKTPRSPPRGRRSIAGRVRIHLQRGQVQASGKPESRTRRSGGVRTLP